MLFFYHHPKAAQASNSIGSPYCKPAALPNAVSYSPSVLASEAAENSSQEAARQKRDQINNCSHTCIGILNEVS